MIGMLNLYFYITLLEM